MTDPHRIAEVPPPGAVGGAAQPAAPDDAPVPTLTAVSWQQAEAHLYPAVMERPDLYQRVVLLVRRTVDRLRAEGPATSALLAAADRGAELVADVLDESGLSAAELDLDLVAKAALAMRHREVRSEQTLLRRLRLVAAARRGGQSWVVLEESGHFDGDPFVPYRRLEAEVATGRALLVTATPDEDFREVRHAVTEVRLALDTGVLHESPDSAPADAFPDAPAREARAHAIKVAQ